MQNGNKPASPSDIAREAIRQLAMRRMPPTPGNYAQLYGEIAGTDAGADAIDVQRMLIGIAQALPLPQPQRDKLERASIDKNWQRVREVLVTGFQASQAAASANWAELIPALLHGLEMRHANLTRARKNESLNHVLSAFSSDAEKLHMRLSGLVKSWNAEPLAGATEVRDPDANVPSAREAALKPLPMNNERQTVQALRELLSSTLQYGVVERLGYSPELAAEARNLAARAKDAESQESLQRVAQDLRQLWIRLELAGESQAELMRGLVSLVEVVLNNVSELVADDRWLHGQLTRVRSLLNSPLDTKTIRRAEREFREVVYKQGTLKHSLDQAKVAFKEMLANFIDRLGAAASNTGDFSNRIEQHVKSIRAAEDIAQLGDLVELVMNDTRSLQTDILQTRDQLQHSRNKAQDYEARIGELQKELEAVSALVKEDPLTRVLNRRGFDEAWEVEVSRCGRQGQSICLGLLDVDNFKQLNDTLGHNAGDDALVHLATIIRAALRPSDIVARYGGEEFVVLLPGADLTVAKEVMTRVQRELTRKFFMYNNARVLITFSAGVTLRIDGEAQQATMERADQALYTAKREGKNRVVAV